MKRLFGTVAILAWATVASAQVTITPTAYCSGTGVCNGTLDVPAGSTLRIEMAQPSTLAATPSQLGTDLAAGVYTITVTALDSGGGQTDDPTAITCTTSGGAAGRCAVTWLASPGAVSYRVWTSLVNVATPTRYFVASGTAYNLDTLTGATVATLPTGNTAYVTLLSPSSASWGLSGLSLIAQSLAAVSTDGFTLSNPTLATVGTTVQISPRMKWCGTGYNSVSTLSETNCFFIETLPFTQAGTTNATLRLGYIAPGGAVTYPMTLTSIGVLSIGSTFTTPGNIYGAAFFLGSGSSTGFLNSADGKVNITNNGNSAGIGFDVTTDSILKGRVRAQNAYATTDWLAYQVSGKTFVATTAPTVASGFGSTSPGTVTANTGTFVIQVTVGTNAGGTAGALTLPSAPAGWACELHDITNTADLTRQSAFTQTSASFTTTVAWTTGDVLVGHCAPF